MRKRRRPALQVRLSPRLPREERENGLDAVGREIQGGQQVYLVAVVSLAGSQVNYRTGATTIHAGIDRVEATTAAGLGKLLDDLTVARCGEPEPILPGMGEL